MTKALKMKGKNRMAPVGRGNDSSGKDYLPGPPRPDGDAEAWETLSRIDL